MAGRDKRWGGLSAFTGTIYQSSLVLNTRVQVIYENSRVIWLLVLKIVKFKISWSRLVKSLLGGTFCRVPGQHKVAYGKTDNSSLGCFSSYKVHWIRTPPLRPHLILIVSQRFISFRSSFHPSYWGSHFKWVWVEMFKPQQRINIIAESRERGHSFCSCQITADLGYVASTTHIARCPLPLHFKFFSSLEIWIYFTLLRETHWLVPGAGQDRVLKDAHC